MSYLFSLLILCSNMQYYRTVIKCICYIINTFNTISIVNTIFFFIFLI